LKAFPVVVSFCLISHLVGYYLLFSRAEPFQYYFYLVVWWSYIVLLDTLYARRRGMHLVLNGNLFFFICISCGYWCFFEILNLRLQNWFYVNLPDSVLFRYPGYFLAFGTVIPAIYLTGKLLHETVFLNRTSTRTKVKGYPYYALFLGTLSLILTALFPVYCFPLAWAFAALILDGYNYLKGSRSLMGDLEEGRPGRLLAAMASGLICGVLWETWNYWNVAKWVYIVPFFGRARIFEMPVAGYLGFIAFGIETETFMDLLSGMDLPKRRLATLAAGAVVLSLCAFPLIDRYTVFSHAAPVEKLSFLSPEKVRSFEQKGVWTSHGIDPSSLEPSEKEALQLIHLKGLGVEAYTKLAGRGIGTIEGLSRSDADLLSQIIDDRTGRRSRVFIEAAKDYLRKKAIRHER
jgi:hypothetical protein